MSTALPLTRPTRRSNPFTAISDEIRELKKYRFVVYSYVYTTTKIRYKRSYLGYVWTVIGPMLHYIMIGFIMGLLLKNKMENYYAHYFSGAVFFSLVAGVLGKAPSILISNEHYIRKIYVPKAIFLLNVVCYEMSNFAMSACSLLVIGFAVGALHLNFSFVTSIAALLLTALFLIGVAGCISVLTVYFRDFGHIIPVLIQAIFFMTPIAYNRGMLPPEYQWITTANPIYYFLEAFRAPLVTGAPAPLLYWEVAATLAVVALVFGFWILKKFDNRIVFKL